MCLLLLQMHALFTIGRTINFFKIKSYIHETNNMEILLLFMIKVFHEIIKVVYEINFWLIRYIQLMVL